MRCPSCKGEVDDRDWLCPYCEHILDPSVLGVDSNEPSSSSIRAERTRLVAWDPGPEEPAPSEPPDAMILGEIDVSSREISIVEGPARQPGGRTSTFLFYTAGATSRIVHPDAVPKLSQKQSTIPHTPYEHFILSCIDGRRSVRAIQKSSGLAPQEVVVTILTLLDKGVITVELESKRAQEEPDENPTIDAEASEALAREIQELPSVRDFREELLSKPLYPSTAGRGQALVAREAAAGATGAADAAEDEDEDDVSPVEPQALDEGDSEMITDHSAPAPKIVAPTPPPKIATPLPKVATPPPKVGTPAPLLLDPAFLMEVPLSERKPAPVPPPPLPSGKRAPIEERDRRKEAVRVDLPKPELAKVEPPKVEAPRNEPPKLEPPKLEALKPEPAKLEPAKLEPAKLEPAKHEPAKHEPAKLEPAKHEPAKHEPAKHEPAKLEAPKAEAGEAAAASSSAKKSKKPEPVDGIRMAKAAKLFEEALKDKKEGNLVSARMNMKLALTFDPTNELYQQAFDDLAKGAGANAVPSKMKNRARELYDAATRAEEEGNVDEAIDLLEKALQESKQAAYYNRLGVLLAMKKREFARAQELIETALKISPGNSTYQHNLGKVLSMAATRDVDAREKGGKSKSGILGFLGRKK